MSDQAKFVLGTPVTLVVEGLATRHTVTAVGVESDEQVVRQVYPDVYIIPSDQGGHVILIDSQDDEIGKSREQEDNQTSINEAWADARSKLPAAPPVPTVCVNGSWFIADGPRAGCAVDGTAYITESK
jgi:hypothetical protein